MLEISFGMSFFLKSSKKESNDRYIYLRVTVDGVPKETSTKRKWDVNRWDTKTERATGKQEDARTLNHFLDTMEMKISKFKTDLMYTEKTISAQRIIDFVLGRITSRAMVLNEFKAHNDEIKALVPKEYALATYKRYETTRFHLTEFIRETRTLPSTMYDPAWLATSEFSTLYLNNATRSSWIIEPQLSWKKDLGDGELNLLLGATFQKQSDNQLVHEADGFTSNALIYNLSAASLLFALRDSETVYKYNAAFARLNYNWKQKYLLNLTGRRDASSRFGTDKRFANFGAVGAAWIFSAENFMQKHMPFLSFGKIRGSYGTTGNDQIGDYQYLNTYGIGSSNYAGVVGLNPTRLYNPDFGWEKNTKLEAALEMGFLNDRLFITAGWFRNRSSSQLVGIPLPGTTGFNTLQANLDATVQNNGYEFTLRSVKVQRTNFRWVTDFNLTTTRNKLIAFPGLEASTYANQYVIGQPLNIVKLYRYTGVDPETGLYTFQDVNGDGLLTPTEDKQTVRDLNPKFFGGLHNVLTYHNWELDFLFQFVKKMPTKPKHRLGHPAAFPTSLLHWPAVGRHPMIMRPTSFLQQVIMRRQPRPIAITRPPTAL